MNNIQSFKWRKGIALSATFLLCLSIIVSCKKKENILGQSAIDQNELLSSGGIDTFSLTTFTYFDDTVISDNAPFGILGSYNDPVFGKFNAEIYTQFRLQGLNPDFNWKFAEIVIDSFVLALEYIGYYGEAGTQNIEVYELLEDLHIDSTYYSFTTKNVSSTDLVVPGMNSVYMDANNLTVVGSDTIDSQLRIHLDKSKAKAMLWDAYSTSSFETNELFLDYFKGLLIKTNNGLQSPGEGGAFYFNLSDPASKLTIYYHQDFQQKTFDFLINSSCADFNHVDIDNTMTQVQTVLDDTLSGQVEYYAQSFGSRAVVKFPGVSNIPSNAVIHSATLELPIEYQTGANYAPGLDMSVAIQKEETGTSLYGVAVGSYSDYTKSFKIDLRAYIQAIISGAEKNNGLILSPILHNTSADRIIFNGPQTTNKNKPILKILYTEF